MKLANPQDQNRSDVLTEMERLSIAGNLTKQQWLELYFRAREIPAPTVPLAPAYSCARRAWLLELAEAGEL